MAQIRYRSAVSPLRRSGIDPRRAGRLALPTVAAVVAAHRPAEPLVCLRPRVLAETAQRFVEAFPGDVLYAVKCNPEPAVLRALYAGGTRHFDCASLSEIRLIRQMFPDAVVHYMHPVKSRAAIRAAYAQYGVRDFALDSREELAKLLEETGQADDLTLVVRLALPRTGAVYELAGKFGAAPGEAVALLGAARRVAARIGLSFHVGSQCLDPGAYERALHLAAQVAEAAAVDLDVLDVGGGFPVSYPGMTPPPLDAFIGAIRRGTMGRRRFARARLWSEPGRALAGPGVSLVVQVERRRGQELYINDGIYGSLSDAGAPGFRFPSRLIRSGGGFSAALEPFALYGPTCDSADRMAGPFLLPADTREGDWIELGQIGAYGPALRTAFNGFDRAGLVEVADPPLLETPGYPLVSCAS